MKENQTSLYIHIPFCEKKCFYCSFVVAVNQDSRADEYLFCLKEEVGKYREKEMQSIYLGGGTPSHLNFQQLKKLIGIIGENFTFKDNCEFTIECNPESIDEDKAKFLFDSGINRISLGIQSLRDSDLALLGRCHNMRQALEAFKLLRKVGFKNINIDMMFGLPGQTKKDLKDSLSAMIDLKSEHISLYALTIEPRSQFYTKRFQLPSEQIQSEHYIMVINELEQADFYQYEISNFAKKGKEARHNIHYWTGGNYIGLGVGAHSHKNGHRWWNVGRLPEYIRKVSQGIDPQEGEERLSPDQRLMEAIVFGLRMNEGVNIAYLEEKFSQSIGDTRRRCIQNLIEQGCLYQDQEFLRTRLEGKLVLDEISSKLI